jgi:hypothetical protein
METKPRIEKGELVFFVGATGAIHVVLEDHTPYVNELRKSGNYFTTKEECKNSKYYKVFHG